VELEPQPKSVAKLMKTKTRDVRLLGIIEPLRKDGGVDGSRF